jgi:hypothetical protein
MPLGARAALSLLESSKDRASAGAHVDGYEAHHKLQTECESTYRPNPRFAAYHPFW